MASLYVFGYSILIFILDEIGRFFNGQCEWLLYGVNIFTLTSILFWIILWIFFWNFDKKLSSKNPRIVLWREKLKKLPIWGGVLIKVIYYILFYWLLISFIPWSTIPYKNYIAALVAIFPVGVVGSFRTYIFDKRGYYTHTQILGHVLGIFLYSVIITVIWVYGGKMTYLGDGFLTNSKITSFLIILFALFNGILLPYAIPYRKAYCIFKKAIKSYKDHWD